LADSRTTSHPVSSARLTYFAFGRPTVPRGENEVVA
jgi:hypothetical protein